MPLLSRTIRKIYTQYNETPRERKDFVKKIEILKKAVSLVVGIGTAKIVHDFIERNVDTSTAYHKVTVGAASTVIGGAVSDLTRQYTDNQIDEIVAFVQKIKNRQNPTDTEE